MKSQLLKKQLVAKMATGGKVGGDGKDKLKKAKSEADAVKNPNMVSSVSDVPKDAVKKVNPDGSITYLVKTKASAPPAAVSKKTSATTAKNNTSSSGSNPKPVLSKKTVAQPPAAEEEYSAYVLPAPEPVKKNVGPGAAIGYIGEIRRDFEGGINGSVNLGGKKSQIQSYLVPGQYNDKTKKWDVEGAWAKPTRISGYTDANGDFVPIDVNYMQPKSSGVYEPNELPKWGNPSLGKKMIAEGAPITMDGATVNDIKSLGGDTTNVNEVNYQRNMEEGVLGKQMGVDKPVVKLKKDIVPAAGLNIGGMKKGGLLSKYAGGGPIINPQIKFDTNNYYNQLQKENGSSMVIPSESPVIDPMSPAKKGILGKLSSMDKQYTGQLLDGAGTLSSAALDVADRKDGRSSIAGQTGTGLLKGAGKGAAIGLNPALLAATGGASAVVAPIVGGVLGATAGAIRGTKEKKMRQSMVGQDIAAGVNDLTNQPFDAKAPSEYKSTMYNEKDFRKGVRGLFAKGGQVKGPGTGTSDDVKAKIQEDSFVVPAKNAKIAEKIRKHMLGSEEKAELNQKGGVPVKLSNGEHVFSPEEVKELMSAGIDLDKLAPESKSKLRGEYKCGGKIPMGYTDGGPVDPKKELAKMESESNAEYEKRKKALDSKKLYDEVLSRYKDRINKRNKQKSEYDRVKVGVDMLQKDYSDLLKYESDKSKWTIDDNEEKIKSKKKELLKKIDNLTTERDKVKQTYDYLSNDANFDKTTGKSKIDLSKKTPLPNSPTAPINSAPKTTSVSTASAGLGPTPKNKGLLGSVSSNPSSLAFNAPPLTPGAGEDDVVVPQSVVTPSAKTGKELLDDDRAKLLNDSALKAQAEINAGKSNPLADIKKRSYGLGDGIGLGLGTLQAGFGLQQLLKDKRPVGQIDPAFDNQTNMAIASSKYGFSPEQKSLMQDQIVQNRIDQQASVNAMAGGNSAVGLNNMRSAINNQVRNQLSMASEDERLRLQKQQYAAGLTGQRAGMRRQLFQDNMDKFMQNQQAGAAVLGAGIQNIVGAQRYAQEKLAQDQINKMMYQPVNITA